MPLLQSLRPAFRRLRRAPGFTILSVGMLAIGIGGTVAAFAVVNAVMLKPLPYPDPERLVGVWHEAPAAGVFDAGVSGALYLVQYRNAQSLASVGTYLRSSVNLTGGDQPQHVRVALTSASFFPTLGVRPAIGRAFTAEEDQPNGARVVVLSNSLWRLSFGADPGIVGRTVLIDDMSHEVIGVMPPRFEFPEAETGLWLPARIHASNIDETAGEFSTRAVARLRDGVTIDAAETELQALLMRMPELNSNFLTKGMLEELEFRVSLHPLRNDVVGDLRPVLWTVLATVALVLLIACSNVANLFLVRAEERLKEVAVRTAVGATRRRIASDYATDGILLTCAGAVIGLVVAWVSLRVLMRTLPASLPRASEVGLDPSIVIVTLIGAVVAGLCFGLLPLLHQGTPDVVAMLRQGTKGATAGRDRRRVRNAFVLAQVALAFVLLVGSALLIRTFQRLRSVDPGFKAENVWTLRLAIPERGGENPRSRTARFQELIDRLEAVPGVVAVGITQTLPLESNDPTGTALWIEDHPTAPNGMPPLHETTNVSSGYFEAMGIPLLEGRLYSDSDPRRVTREAVVSRSFAEHYWPGGSALGERISPSGPGLQWNTIVGVVGDIHTSLLRPPAEAVYLPTLTAVNLAGRDTVQTPGEVAFAVRTAGGSAASVTAALRETVAAFDPTLPVINLRPMTDVVAGATALTAFTMAMLTIAGVVALLLGAIGIYGVTAYMVSLRTREIGVRMALGARRNHVHAMVTRQAMLLAVGGIGIGILGAMALSELVASLLYEVNPTDPVTWAAVALSLLVVAAAASWVPARRAASIDPLEAMRID